MTIKEQIIKTMGYESEMTARKISELSGIPREDVSKCLHTMVRKGQAVDCGTKGGRKLYTLTGSRAVLPRGAIRKYIRENPGLTVAQIVSGMPCRKNTAESYIRNAFRDGYLARSVNQNGEFTWSVIETTEMPFGCGNPLTLMFNHALAEVRKNQTNLLK